MNTERVIADLRELVALTSNARGAQRVAWTAPWREARAWLAAKAGALALRVEPDAAGNRWIVLPGRSTRTVILGSHLDSVPDGGWLDGALGILAAFEALRSRNSSPPPVTLALVDWADEEGRFGMSLLGSSAAAGRLDLNAARAARDRDGVPLADALAEDGVSLERIREANRALRNLDAHAYLELHIEQGPVLAALGRSTGVVVGTFGIERHRLRFTGQAAHAGSTPMPMRRDAFLAAAEFALECRGIAVRHSRPGRHAVCTTGAVSVQPGIPTAVPGACEIALDQRALDATVLESMVTEAREASRRAAEANNVEVTWERVWRIEPRPFHTGLIELAAEAVQEEAGDAPRLPSGPVHDASELAPLVPTVMLFACSPNGLSHCNEEDTPEPQLAEAIRAYLRLVEKSIAAVAAGDVRSGPA